MNKTVFSEKCRILGDLWLYYREDIQGTTWEEFFAYNDIALPAAYFIAQDLVIPSGDGEIESFIDDTWDMFCEAISIDPQGWYKDLDEAFAASPNAPLVAS